MVGLQQLAMHRLQYALAKMSKPLDNSSHLLNIIQALERRADQLPAAGLADGVAGISLLYAYYAKASGRLEYKTRAEALLESALSKLESHPEHGVSFASGLIGIVWVIQHLSQYSLITSDAEELLLESDELVYHWSLKQLDEGHYDYLNAGLGGLVYLFDRIENPAVDMYLRDLLGVLLAKVVAIKPGAIWPCGLVDAVGLNLTVPHGMISVLAVLGLYYERGIRAADVKQAAFTIANFIESRIEALDSGNLVPCIAYLNKSDDFSERLAWCYGNLGASFVLNRVGNIFGWLPLQNSAQELALSAAKKRSHHGNFVKDACLCHGIAGASYIFYKWYKCTNIQEFKEASEYWNSQLVSPIGKPLDWDAYNFWLGADFGWQPSLGLFDGLTGVGLSLLTQAEQSTASNEQWDRLLLMS